MGKGGNPKRTREKTRHISARSNGGLDGPALKDRWRCYSLTRCTVCQNTMRVIAVIDERRAVEKILRHLGLWSGAPLLRTGLSPPATGPWAYLPYGDVDPMPEYENVLTD